MNATACNTVVERKHHRQSAVRKISDIEQSRPGSSRMQMLAVFCSMKLPIVRLAVNGSVITRRKFRQPASIVFVEIDAHNVYESKESQQSNSDQWSVHILFITSTATSSPVLRPRTDTVLSDSERRMLLVIVQHVHTSQL